MRQAHGEPTEEQYMQARNQGQRIEVQRWLGFSLSALIGGGRDFNGGPMGSRNYKLTF